MAELSVCVTTSLTTTKAVINFAVDNEVKQAGLSRTTLELYLVKSLVKKTLGSKNC